jgi:hypothetical protein
MTTFFFYAPRRVRCPEHGICVEHLPWALGKRPLTRSYAWFLASWAKLLSWQDVSRTFNASWESVFRSVEMAVDGGRARMDKNGITAIGADEIYWAKGKFLTARPAAQRPDSLCLLGYVATLPDGDRAASQGGTERPRSLPHCGEDEYGDRRGAGEGDP